MRQLIRYLIWFLPLFAAYNSQAQNNTVYGAGISYTNGVPSWTPNPRTSRAAVDTVTGRWYHFNTPGGWQWIGNTVEEIAGCAAPAYTPDKGDSRLVINNCVKPQVYWYDGLTWKWINQGEVYTAGQGIRIESNTIILDSLYVLRFRTGSNTDGAAGTMSWNTTEETVDLVTDQGAVTGHLMESAYYNTRNTTGTPITIGTVVMANGTTGNTGRILIAPAIADGSVNSEYILGLAAQTIGNNSNGKVQHFGKIRGIQTNGANYGETWVDGDVLYCSAVTPGYLTKVLPTAPNLKVPIAIVIHAHPSNGTLFVRPSHFPDLAQINDVQLSSPTNGQVLTWNSTTTRWEAITPANQLQTLSTDNTPGNISISSGNTITLNVNDADASATNELQTLSVAANTATLSNSGGSVTIAGAGINTVGTAGTTITVTGTEVDGSTTNELQTLSTGTNTLTLSNGGGTVTVDTNPADDVTGTGANGQAVYWLGTQTQAGSPLYTFDPAITRLTLSRELSRLSLGLQGNGSGDVQVGSSGLASPSIGLQDYGYYISHNAYRDATGAWLHQRQTSIPAVRHFGGGGVASGISGFHWDYSANVGAAAITWTNLMRLSTAGNLSIGTTSSAARLHVLGSGTSSSTWTAQFHNSAGNNNALMIRDDGNVGIGTTSLTGVNFRIFKNITGATVARGLQNGGIIQPDVTSDARLFASDANSATGVTLTRLVHYYAGQGSLSGTITNQYGFYIDNTLTGATNNYGFFSTLNTAPGRYNLYMEGTAPNLLNGRLFIPTGSYDNPSLSFVGDENTGLYRPADDNLELKTGTNNAIILENQATNLKINSENLTLSSPLNLNITVTNPGTILAPDGTFTANLAAPNTVSNVHLFGHSATLASPHTFSVYAKAAGYNFISLAVGGNTDGQTIVFNLSNGTITGTAVGFTAQIENVGNGWYRCALTNTVPAAGTNAFRWMFVRNSSSISAFVGDGVSGVYFWGVQYEESLNATSYIKTEATAVTRPQAVSVLGPNVYGTLITKTLAAPSLKDLSFNTQNTTRLTVASSGNVGIGTTSPNGSAALDVSSTTQGILFPRMTTTQRNAIATPADGLVIYNTTDNKLQVRAGGAWVDLH